ncbi:MAG: hypothetical protein ACLRJV_05150 [Eubacteriales bacterium]
MARSLSKKEGHKLNSWKIVPYCVVIPCMLIYLIFFYFNVTGRRLQLYELERHLC